MTRRRRAKKAGTETTPRSIQTLALVGLLIVLAAFGGVGAVISLRENDLDPLLSIADRPLTMLIVGAMIALVGGGSNGKDYAERASEVALRRAETVELIEASVAPATSFGFAPEADTPTV